MPRQEVSCPIAKTLNLHYPSTSMQFPCIAICSPNSSFFIILHNISCFCNHKRNSKKGKHMVKICFHPNKTEKKRAANCHTDQGCKNSHHIPFQTPSATPCHFRFNHLNHFNELQFSPRPKKSLKRHPTRNINNRKTVKSQCGHV